VPMVGHWDAAGVYQFGIEDYLSSSQYARDEHQHAVVEDIAANWNVLSQDGKFHAIFATSSITEAITYYRLMKARSSELKITALFDPHISDDDDGDDPALKAEALVEIIADYNASFGQNFDLGAHANFRKDLAARLAHKKPYLRVEAEPVKRLDLLIVVNQMLTGFDSKWVNTLYLDKLLEYENVIQAFSRTNRLYGPDKPFGTIRYYRKPHSMKRNVEAAVKLYSGDRPIRLFADRLPMNIERMNASFVEISEIFSAAGISDFMKLPDDLSARAAFAKQFNHFSGVLEAAKIQGFVWEKATYKIAEEPKREITLAIAQREYLTLLQRYKELGGGGGGGGENIPYEIESHITEIDTGRIDADYMNSRFAKYLKVLESGDEQAKESTLADLQRSFASLSQEDQKIAEIFLRDIQRGDVQIDPNRTFREYLTDYKAGARAKKIATIVACLGVDSAKLIALMNTNVTEANLNEYGRFDELKATIDKGKAKAYFEPQEGRALPNFRVNIKAANLLQRFILEDGFELGESADP
jgi:type I restriction enzyme, R subunit